MSDRDDIAAKRRAAHTAQPKKLALWQKLFAGAIALSMPFIGYGVYIMNQTPDEVTVEAAKPEEWQEDGTGFGNVDTGNNAETITQIVQSPEDIKLRAEIAALKAQIKNMAQNDGTKNLATEIAALKTQMEATEKARTAAALVEKKRLDKLLKDEKARVAALKTKLEQAKLQAGIDAAADIDAQLASQLEAQLEAERRATLEEQRREAIALRKAQVESNMIVLNGSGKEPDATQGTTSQALSKQEAFRSSASTSVVTSYSEEIASPELTIGQGTIIRASLETALDSSLPGLIRAVISDDVHSMDGHHILIPRGSKVIGEYQSQLDLNQKRVNIVWTRIQLSDGRYVTLKGFGADRLGRAGVAGRVNTHFGARFGGAALISIIAAVPDIAAANVDNDTASDTLENVGSDLSAATGDAISDYLSIPPTIYVPQGSDITIIVDRDLVIFP